VKEDKRFSQSVSGDGWPFAATPKSVAFITTQVLERAEPILHAIHDQHGEWQFLGVTKAAVENARIIALREVVELDPSVLVLADLPSGWHAARRSPGGPWRKEPYTDTRPTR
jgi:hypothetical protein